MKEIGDLRSLVARSCRILAMEGLIDEITGHVSVRLPEADRMLIRCRGDVEAGVGFTLANAVRVVSLDGEGDEVTEAYSTPIELPIHGEVLRARPDVHCVIHAHPPAALLCGILGLELRPIVGSFDPEVMQIAAAGVPIFKSSVLISTQELGRQLVDALGDRPVCLMAGHGMTVVGSSVEQATITAIRVERLARLTLQVAQTGLVAPDISSDDLAAFQRGAERPLRPQLRARGTEWVWRHYTGRLAAEDRRLGIDEMSEGTEGMLS